MKHAVYRFFDASGRLLYVGRSSPLVHRWHQHEREARWIERAVTATITWFDTREEAMGAETRAITTEKSRYNRAPGRKNESYAPKLSREEKARRWAQNHPLRAQGLTVPKLVKSALFVVMQQNAKVEE